MSWLYPHGLFEAQEAELPALIYLVGAVSSIWLAFEAVRGVRGRWWLAWAAVALSLANIIPAVVGVSVW